MLDLDNVCLEVEKGQGVEYQTISPEIVLTSSFQFKNFEHYVNVNSKGEKAYTYTRDGNPTLAILEEKIAKLEGGECGKAFASGMGAISSAILSLVKQGDHIIIVNTVYGSSVKLIQQMSKFGVESTKIDVVDTKEIFDHIKENTKMIYFESPSSQKFEMLDLEMISKVAREKDIYTMIDNTWSTPLLQNPLKHGIDIVMHSCSKYIGGHSDIVGGVLVSRKELIDKIEAFGQILLGATMSPMNAWLAIRGLRTLPVRLKSQEETLKAVISFMEQDPRIEKIYHPLCNGDKQKALADQYLKGYGSLLGVILKDATPTIIEKFVDTLNHFTLAYSWGGFESLIMPVFKGSNEQELKERGLSLGQLRMYIGLEETELLIDDLKKALDYAYQ
ncbi:MAG: aminotransferase class I/II-fold pyridoxal phosphate-dependent enzyme [Coprobacillus sp.]